MPHTLAVLLLDRALLEGTARAFAFKRSEARTSPDREAGVNRQRLATALRQALATVREAVTSNEESSLLSSVFDAIVRAEASMEGQGGAPSSSGQRSTRLALTCCRW